MPQTASQTKPVLPSTATGRKRLLKLADLLKADAKNKKGVKFDLSAWGRIGDKREPLSCGTTACAVGLAIISGAFKREGLRAGQFSTSLLFPTYRHHSDWEATSAFFSITNDQAEWLFMDESYPVSHQQGARGERAVAKRIRDFVAGRASPAA